MERAFKYFISKKVGTFDGHFYYKEIVGVFGIRGFGLISSKLIAWYQVNKSKRQVQDILAIYGIEIKN